MAVIFVEQRYKLILTKEEAEWLKDRLQNPLENEEETLYSYEIRKALFEALKDSCTV